MLRALQDAVLCAIPLAGLLSSRSIALAAAPAPQKTSGPNIVLIVADDLGWNGVGYHDGFCRTPNINRIVHDGVELDRFYVSPMCSPTRAGLLTGRYPMHFGMARSVVHPWSHDGLPAIERTLAEALGQAGYADRALFGKWHLGHLDPKWHPLCNGFTQFQGCYTGAIDYFTHERVGQVDWHTNFDDTDPPGYATDLIADASAKFIRSHARRGPFFCYTAFTAPHEPLEAPQSYIDRVLKRDHRPSGSKPTDQQMIAAMTMCLDDGIGRILDAIDQAGIRDQTLIWFLSDNGGISRIPDNNAPLRGSKFTVYEGGVRMPAGVWWPGHIEGGRKITTPILNIDVMPTLLSICEESAASPAGPIDGVDVSGLLLNKTSKTIKPRDLYFFTGQWGLDNEQIAVTDPDDWKLVVIGPDVRRPGGYRTPRHQVDLYHLNIDSLEQHDLAAQEPQKVKELGAKVIAFRASEPRHSMGPINHKPPNFQPPPHWHNGPPTSRPSANHMEAIVK